MLLDKFVFEKKNIEAQNLETLFFYCGRGKGYNGKENKKSSGNSELSNLVPGTGFEPAHPCERCDLNTVRLPISPSGQFIQGCKYRKTAAHTFKSIK